MKLNIKNFTPVYDSMVAKYGIIGAMIYGRVERLSHKFGHCFASKESIGDMLDLSPQTIRKYVKWQILDGYIQDLDPGVRNKPHRLRPTGLAQLEVNIEAVDGGNEITTSENGNNEIATGSNEITTSPLAGGNEISMNKEDFKKERKEENLIDFKTQTAFDTWKISIGDSAPRSTFLTHIAPMEILKEEINFGSTPDQSWMLLEIACPVGSSALLRDRIFSYKRYTDALRLSLGVFNLQIKLIERS